MPTRSAPMETALLHKLGRLPVTTRRKLRLRHFNFSHYPVLCWYHGVARGGRRYTMQCDVLEDGALDVSFTAQRGFRKTRPVPRAKRF